jgi:hypothetical protein
MCTEFSLTNWEVVGKNTYISKHYIHMLLETVNIMGVISKKIGFRIEYLGKFEAICETALARESGL